MALSQLQQRVLDAMLTMSHSGPNDNTLGICANVVQIMEPEGPVDEDGVDDILTELFSTWPDKSSSTAYPVGKWSRNPSKIFWHFHDGRRSMWDTDSKYGTARWSLLNHCIIMLIERKC